MLITTFILAFRSIRRHLMRSFLTTLGIIIGVAAVVTMVTLGQATTLAVQKQIASLGNNILQVRPGQGFGRGGGGPQPPNFDAADVAAVRDQIAGIIAVAPQASSPVTAVYEGSNWTTTVNGTTSDLFQIQPWPLVAGRSFEPDEEQAGKAVCIIGNTVRKNLFTQAASPAAPLGQRVRLNGISCLVIGVLSARGQAGFGGDQDDVVIMPIKTVQRRLTGNLDIRLMLVGVDQAYDSPAVQSAITGLLRERRKISGGKQDDFNIFDTAQISATLTGTTTLLTGIVTAVAAISLVVGGIGIMNIMLVSVTERTREIGIRLAIGALANEVLTQFLVEAIVLSCLGGIIGIALAQVLVVIIAPLMQVPWLFVPQINVIAFLIAAAIGVVFGYFPARRAAGLNPIDALRYE
jgi:putative ABC transport system permease protein